MSMNAHEVPSPIPKSYSGCIKCKKSEADDCGEHSMDFTWRIVVATLQAANPRLTNERDRWKAKHEELSRKKPRTGK